MKVGTSRDEAIGRIASAQRGLVTRAQLVASGVRHGAIAHRVRRERLYRVHRGVYLVGHRAMAPLARELAAVLACGSGAVLSHRSAAALWGFLPASDGDVDVSVLVHGRRSRPGIRVHRLGASGPDETTVRLGLPVTTPPRTLVDLAAVSGRRELERALAEARAAQRSVARSRLAALLDRHPDRQGTGVLRELLEREQGPALTRSEAEERMLALVGRAGLPRPRTNVRVGRYEVDFLWSEKRLAVEVDGYAFHSSPAAFERDRRRDAEMAANGLRVLRVTWRQVVERPEAVAANLAAALAMSGGP